jgi:predicted Zn-dependent protease
VTALLAALTVGASTRWLLASVAYAEGTRLGIAGRMSEAYGEFRHSLALVPTLPLAAEAAASAALRLAGAENDLPRRLQLLREAEAILVQARRYALGGPVSWALSAQIAFAEVRAGERSRLAAGREAFAVALALRPGDAKLRAQSAWMYFESGDAVQARQEAQRALDRDAGEWLAWAILARSSEALGDREAAERAARKARDLAPPQAHRLLDGS